MDLTNEDVADILALLDSLPYDSLDVETPRFRLTLRRAPGGGWTEESSVRTEPSLLTVAPDGAAASPPATPAPSAAGGAADSATDIPSGPGGLAPVTAPLPGTFYRAPRPGAGSFVEVGDVVTPDTVVAIVETMKLMNPVRAGTAGRIASISLANGEPAALGATLMLIEPGQ
jgi:acetyl-CoA carboxylase biotin carboxyl carrier protein